jgi:lysophospholipase L1-like esterase
MPIVGIPLLFGAYHFLSAYNVEKLKGKQVENLPQAIQYLALGDSLTVGFGTFISPDFVKLYHRMTQQTLQRPVSINKVARIGATTLDMLKSIEVNNSLHRSIDQADIITITIGGNDLIRAAKEYVKTGDQSLFQEALENCKRNVREILSEIHKIKLRKTNRYIIRLVNLYNPYPHIKEADVWVRAFNMHLQSFEGWSVRVADVYSVFLGRERELLFWDGKHPNAEGYKVIANTDMSITRFGLPKAANCYTSMIRRTNMAAFIK